MCGCYWGWITTATACPGACCTFCGAAADIQEHAAAALKKQHAGIAAAAQ
jgi:hypothetical protein